MKNLLLFLIGRVKSREKELLSQDQWQRLSAPSGLSDFLAQLKDTPYAEAAELALTFENFETGLNKIFLHLKQDLFAWQQYEFEPLLWRKYDYHNFKTLLKMKLAYKDLRKYLIPLGEIPLEVLEKFLVAQEKAAYAIPYYKLLKEAQNVYKNNNQNFASMDMFLDQKYFAEMLQTAGTYGPAVVYFYRRQIDLANFKLWRSRQDFAFPLQYIQGGSLKTDFFAAAQDSVAEQVLQKLFPELNTDSQKDDALLEKYIDDQLSAHLFTKRFAGGNLLPVLVFFRALEIELKNLKICYLRQARNLGKLTEFMRYTYA